MPDHVKKVYVKDNSFDPIYKSVNLAFYFKSKILSGALMALGFVVLTSQVVIPLIFFKTQDTVSKPVRSSVLGVATGFNDFEFEELKEKSIKQINQDEAIPEFFYLSVPKLKIKGAIVETNSTNLSPETSLGHYKGSALPGNNGNSFIYGHSVLPWFFNPNNYKTIFSTLGDLKPGDEIIIEYNDSTLTYVVEKLETLYPNQINPIGDWKPKYLNDKTLTLMTCWPAGTRSQRLLVRAMEK